ncbi:MAG: hypothetical protein ACREKH_15110, partial [Candidatus Rokuibacteriota bacterium]
MLLRTGGVLMAHVILTTLVLLLLSLSAPAWADVFASPTGTGTTCSEATPCSTATMLSQVTSTNPGWLLDGEYKGSGYMFVPPTGKS